ncbi:acetate/propionate family kinase [Mesorhizobium sp. BR1-1-16]|uniref:acetate/propionate family kinase n=1 Tax=Mesorhizobium sp. BR1-1-16 TaxID=2876653 RepID=UPI001CC928BD|nr:acetate/propionate family kinase [Mesorhizobium sp. BR1-1-16]MBZ9937767.1 acetate/propionate family kinase [Mesorhizobium sp. BR1-1-16]
MAQPTLLTFNAGSSTVKLGLFAMEEATPRRFGNGMVDLRREPLMLHVTEGAETADIPLDAKVAEELDEVVAETLDVLATHFAHEAIAGAGHRIVHGGDRFHGPARIDDETLKAIEDLVPLAPLHQPQGLRLIRSLRRLRPDIPQSASFDTAFHQTQTDAIRRLPLPREWFDRGVKRYGFHGLSYRFVASELARIAPDIAARKVVVAHLGSGASLCAIENGESRATSMTFSTLDGIVMATRPGSLDPGVIIHLAKGGLSVDAIEDMLYHRSGLLGLSGISADARDLAASAAPEAHDALNHFARTIAETTASLGAVLEGLDAIVFTAGIGEHQPALRADVCRRLGFLGVAIDAAKNARNAQRIDAASSRIAVFVIPTDEEQVIAEEAASLIAAGS